MMYTMPKNLLSICVNFALATQLIERSYWKSKRHLRGTGAEKGYYINRYTGNHWRRLKSR